jgi:hypothetical protein
MKKTFGTTEEAGAAGAEEVARGRRYLFLFLWQPSSGPTIAPGFRFQVLGLIPSFFYLKKKKRGTPSLDRKPLLLLKKGKREALTKEDSCTRCSIESRTNLTDRNPKRQGRPPSPPSMVGGGGFWQPAVRAGRVRKRKARNHFFFSSLPSLLAAAFAQENDPSGTERREQRKAFFSEYLSSSPGNPGPDAIFWIKNR